MPEVAVDVKSLPKSQVELVFDVPAENVDAAYDRVLQRLGQRLKIEGFRPGKAPRAVFEARVGPTALREEVIDSLIPQLVSDALTEHSLEPVDRPQVEVAELERGRPGIAARPVEHVRDASLHLLLAEQRFIRGDARLG